jgi:hypothetical protein
MMENIYYVYEWYFIDTDNVFYVGKGKGRRYREQKDRNDKFKNYINKYKCNVRKVFENLTEDVAYQKEIELIAYYKNIRQCKCNLTDGGDAPPVFRGVNAYNRREVVQLSINGEYIKTWQYIQEIEKELNISNAHITACCKGRFGKRSAGGYLWIYKEDYDCNKTYSYKRISRAKKVLQYSLDGYFVKEWESLTQISETLGFMASGISMSISGKYGTCGGYVWKSKENTDFPLYINLDASVKAKVPIPIVQLDLNSNYIQTHKNAVEASVLVSGTKKNNSGIIYCCKGERRTAKGFKWMFEYEYISKLKQNSKILQ